MRTGSRCKDEEKLYPAQLATLGTSIDKVALAQSRACALLGEMILAPRSERNHPMLLEFELRLSEIYQTAIPGRP